MTTDLDIFRTLLRDAIVKHFTKAKNDNPGLYGYSLYTEDDLSSIGGVFNCEADISTPESDDMYSYYRYGAVEWQHFEDYGLFDKANALLTEILGTCSDDEWGDRKQQVLDACLDELVALDANDFFGVKDTGRFVVICLSDSDHPIMDRSAKVLNSQEIYAAYAREFTC